MRKTPRSVRFPSSCKKSSTLEKAADRGAVYRARRALRLHTISAPEKGRIFRFYFTRSIYSPVRVSTRMVSPSLTNMGT